MTLPAPSIPSHLLEPGERILWHARPRQGLIWRPADWFTVPFSILWFGFSLVWTAFSSYALYAAIRHADHFEWPFLIVFPLIGVVFCVVGYQFAIGRFFKDANERAQTFYALSNTRAFVLLQGADGHVAYLPVSPDTEFEHSVGPDGFGALRFLSGMAVFAQSRPNREPLSTFEFSDVRGLDDALRVIKRIQENRA